MAQKYVIAHFFKPEADGYNFSANEWPLHVTLLPNFTLRKSLEELESKIEEVALNTPSFEIEPQDRAVFGPNQDVPVMLIKPSDDLIGLHNNLIKVLDEVVATYDTPQYIADGYRPHATIQENGQVKVVQTYKVDNISLVDMFPGNDINRRAVIRTYSLKLL